MPEGRRFILSAGGSHMRWSVAYALVVATVVAVSGCTSVEEFEGNTDDCSAGPAEADVWMLVERGFLQEPRIFFGTAPSDQNARDTWLVGVADDINDKGNELTFSVTFQVGGEAETFELALERTDDVYAGTVEGDTNVCDIELERVAP